MKTALLFGFGAVCGVVVATLPRIAVHLHGALLHSEHGNRQGPGGARAHTEEKFVFTAHAPMQHVAPLFGADRERVWAPEWDPHFIHPLPASDEQGMVFAVAHGHMKSVWVNTQFDPTAGRIQYVYVIPDALVTVITIKLTPEGNQTHVEVEYARTALSEEADGHVQHMAEQDRSSGPDWEKQVNGYLEKPGIGRKAAL